MTVRARRREYRGHTLVEVEWGLWKDVTPDRDKWYLLSYRPRGRRGPYVRRFVYAAGPPLSILDLKKHVRNVRSRIEARKAEVPVSRDAYLALDDYSGELARRNRSDKHRSDVVSCLSRFLTRAGVLSLDDVTLRVVESFLRGVSEGGASPRTQNKYRAHLSAWFTWAVGRGHMESNPVVRIPPATQVRRLKEFPLPPEMTALALAGPTPYNTAMHVLLAFTGLRRGAFLALGPESFRDDGIVVRHTKERADWFLAFDAGCPLWAPELTRIGRAVWRIRPPTPRVLNDGFKSACATIDRSYTLHSLKHGFCSWLAMIGEDSRDVSAWAHHSNERTTNTWYSHLRPGGRENAAPKRAAVDTMRTQCLAACQPLLTQTLSA